MPRKEIILLDAYFLSLVSLYDKSDHTWLVVVVDGDVALLIVDHHSSSRGQKVKTDGRCADLKLSLHITHIFKINTE